MAIGGLASLDTGILTGTGDETFQFDQSGAGGAIYTGSDSLTLSALNRDGSGSFSLASSNLRGTGAESFLRSSTFDVQGEFALASSTLDRKGRETSHLAQAGSAAGNNFSWIADGSDSFSLEETNIAGSGAGFNLRDGVGTESADGALAFAQSSMTRSGGESYQLIGGNSDNTHSNQFNVQGVDSFTRMTFKQVTPPDAGQGGTPHFHFAGLAAGDRLDQQGVIALSRFATTATGSETFDQTQTSAALEQHSSGGDSFTLDSWGVSAAANTFSMQTGAGTETASGAAVLNQSKVTQTGSETYSSVATQQNTSVVADVVTAVDSATMHLTGGDTFTREAENAAGSGSFNLVGSGNETQAMAVQGAGAFARLVQSATGAESYTLTDQGFTTWGDGNTDAGFESYQYGESGSDSFQRADDTLAASGPLTLDDSGPSAFSLFAQGGFGWVSSSDSAGTGHAVHEAITGPMNVERSTLSDVGQMSSALTFSGNERTNSPADDTGWGGASVNTFAGGETHAVNYNSSTDNLQASGSGRLSWETDSYNHLGPTGSTSGAWQMDRNVHHGLFSQTESGTDGSHFDQIGTMTQAGPGSDGRPLLSTGSFSLSQSANDSYTVGANGEEWAGPGSLSYVFSDTETGDAAGSYVALESGQATSHQSLSSVVGSLTGDGAGSFDSLSNTLNSTDDVSQQFDTTAQGPGSLLNIAPFNGYAAPSLQSMAVAVATGGPAVAIERFADSSQLASTPSAPYQVTSQGPGALLNIDLLTPSAAPALSSVTSNQSSSETYAQQTTSDEFWNWLNPDGSASAGADHQQNGETDVGASTVQLSGQAQGGGNFRTGQYAADASGQYQYTGGEQSNTAWHNVGTMPAGVSLNTAPFDDGTDSFNWATSGNGTYSEHDAGHDVAGAFSYDSYARNDAGQQSYALHDKGTSAWFSALDTAGSWDKGTDSFTSDQSGNQHFTTHSRGQTEGGAFVWSAYTDTEWGAGTFGYQDVGTETWHSVKDQQGSIEDGNSRSSQTLNGHSDFNSNAFGSTQSNGSFALTSYVRDDNQYDDVNNSHRQAFITGHQVVTPAANNVPASTTDSQNSYTQDQSAGDESHAHVEGHEANGTLVIDRLTTNDLGGNTFTLTSFNTLTWATNANLESYVHGNSTESSASEGTGSFTRYEEGSDQGSTFSVNSFTLDQDGWESFTRDTNGTQTSEQPTDDNGSYQSITQTYTNTQVGSDEFTAEKQGSQYGAEYSYSLASMYRDGQEASTSHQTRDELDFVNMVGGSYGPGSLITGTLTETVDQAGSDSFILSEGGANDSTGFTFNSSHQLTKGMQSFTNDLAQETISKLNGVDGSTDSSTNTQTLLTTGNSNFTYNQQWSGQAGKNYRTDDSRDDAGSSTNTITNDSVDNWSKPASDGSSDSGFVGTHQQTRGGGTFTQSRQQAVTGVAGAALASAVVYSRTASSHETSSLDMNSDHRHYGPDNGLYNIDTVTLHKDGTSTSALALSYADTNGYRMDGTMVQDQSSLETTQSNSSSVKRTDFMVQSAVLVEVPYAPPAQRLGQGEETLTIAHAALDSVVNHQEFTAKPLGAAKFVGDDDPNNLPVNAQGDFTQPLPSGDGGFRTTRVRNSSSGTDSYTINDTTKKDNSVGLDVYTPPLPGATNGNMEYHSASTMVKHGGSAFTTTLSGAANSLGSLVNATTTDRLGSESFVQDSLTTNVSIDFDAGKMWPGGSSFWLGRFERDSRDHREGLTSYVLHEATADLSGDNSHITTFQLDQTGNETSALTIHQTSVNQSIAGDQWPSPDMLPLQNDQSMLTMSQAGSESFVARETGHDDLVTGLPANSAPQYQFTVTDAKLDQTSLETVHSQDSATHSGRNFDFGSRGMFPMTAGQTFPDALTTDLTTAQTNVNDTTSNAHIVAEGHKDVTAGTFVLDTYSFDGAGAQTYSSTQASTQSFHNQQPTLNSLIEDGGATSTMTRSGSDSYTLGETGSVGANGSWQLTRYNQMQSGQDSFTYSQNSWKDSTESSTWRQVANGALRAYTLDLAGGALPTNVVRHLSININETGSDGYLETKNGVGDAATFEHKHFGTDSFSVGDVVGDLGTVSIGGSFNTNKVGSDQWSNDDKGHLSGGAEVVDSYDHLRVTSGGVADTVGFNFPAVVVADVTLFSAVSANGSLSVTLSTNDHQWQNASGTGFSHTDTQNTTGTLTMHTDNQHGGITDELHTTSTNLTFTSTGGAGSPVADDPLLDALDGFADALTGNEVATGVTKQGSSSALDSMVSQSRDNTTGNVTRTETRQQDTATFNGGGQTHTWSTYSQSNDDPASTDGGVDNGQPLSGPEPLYALGGALASMARGSAAGAVKSLAGQLADAGLAGSHTLPATVTANSLPVISAATAMSAMQQLNAAALAATTADLTTVFQPARNTLKQGADNLRNSAFYITQVWDSMQRRLDLLRQQVPTSFAPTLPPPPPRPSRDALDWATNTFAAWSDKLTFGLTDSLRSSLGLNDAVDKNSAAYQLGSLIGSIHLAALGLGSASGFLGGVQQGLNLIGFASGVGDAVKAAASGDLLGAVTAVAGAVLAGTRNLKVCAWAPALRMGAQSLVGLGALQSGMAGFDKLLAGDYVGGLTDLTNVAASLYFMSKSCFVKGTLMKLNEKDSKPIEEFKSYEDHGDAGDTILTRSEFDPEGPLQLKRVLRVFVRVAPILNLHVKDDWGVVRIIGTTGEHPFYVHADRLTSQTTLDRAYPQGEGFLEAHYLQKGDQLRTSDGRRLTVEGIAPSGRVETVYNLEVEDCHTYFVGGAEWGWDVWAHNATNYQSVQNGVVKYQGIADTGKTSTLSRRLAAAGKRTPAAKSAVIPGTSGHTTLESQQMEQALIHYHDRELAAAGGTLVNQYRGVNLSPANLSAGYSLLSKIDYWSGRHFSVHIDGSGI